MKFFSSLGRIFMVKDIFLKMNFKGVIKYCYKIIERRVRGIFEQLLKYYLSTYTLFLDDSKADHYQLFYFLLMRVTSKSLRV